MTLSHALTAQEFLLALLQNRWQGEAWSVEWEEGQGGEESRTSRCEPLGGQHVWQMPGEALRATAGSAPVACGETMPVM